VSLGGVTGYTPLKCKVQRQRAKERLAEDQVAPSLEKRGVMGAVMSAEFDLSERSIPEIKILCAGGGDVVPLVV
jgi:hypothetical protein